MENKKKLNVIKILGYLLIIFGLIGFIMITLYKKNSEITVSEKIDNYEKFVSKLNESEKNKIYNNLSNWNNNKNIDDYYNIKVYDKMIGYIEIPKIDIKLPIYFGTSDEILSIGIGHLETTDLPIGENNSHSVLTGHNGLVDLKAFTDLNKLEINDIFSITILDSTNYYIIDEIKTISASDNVYFKSDEMESLVTLVTCTPYAFYTDRLLIKAKKM